MSPCVYAPAEDSWLLAETIVRGQSSGRLFVDVGTGTGIQGALACKAGFREVVATDISPCAVYAAKMSLEESCKDKALIHVVQCDLVSCLRGGVKADIIAFNPPYLPAKSNSAGDECLDYFMRSVESDDVMELVGAFVEQAKHVGFDRLYLVLSSLSGLTLSRMLAEGFSLKTSRRWFFEEVYVLALESKPRVRLHEAKNSSRRTGR